MKKKKEKVELDRSVFMVSRKERGREGEQGMSTQRVDWQKEGVYVYCVHAREHWCVLQFCCKMSSLLVCLSVQWYNGCLVLVDDVEVVGVFF